MSGGREFQRIDAATGNERRLTVARRYVGTCSWPGMMMISADGDDQADQQGNTN